MKKPIQPENKKEQRYLTLTGGNGIVSVINRSTVQSR